MKTLSQITAEKFAAALYEAPITAEKFAAALYEATVVRDSYGTLPFIIKHYRQAKAWGVLPGFFKTLGKWWSCCDNISAHALSLHFIFKSATRRHLNEMMTEEERSAFADLPKTISAYRGAYPVNIEGFSYTLDKGVAKRFPTLNRYRISGATPILINVEIPKRYCVLKLDRGEHEVICVNRRAVVITGTEIIKLEGGL